MRLSLVTLALLGAALPASAGIPVTQEMTCPIGGKKFQHETTASYSTYGERPDGKPYGSWKFPLALPECPDNGLVLYKDYDAAETAKLEPLVASKAYQELRQETPYYRAYWLMREMGLGPERYLWALLQASWEADGKPELRARYLSELAETSAKVEPRPGDLNWIGMEGRAVNALRELGRFEEAKARLAGLPLQSLDVTVPAPAGGNEKQVAEAKNRRAWHSFLTKLSTAIERGDSSPEPFNLIPRRVAISRCANTAQTLDQHQRAFCDTDLVKAEVAKLLPQPSATQP